MPLPDESLIASLLGRVRHIALVGASANPARPSHQVMAFLQARGYRVSPVNPGLAGQTLLGEKVVARLSEVVGPVDMVDIFRQSDAVPGLVEEAIAIGAGAVWMQLGIRHEAAAARARAAGLAVVSDRCPAIEIPRLGLAPVGAPPGQPPQEESAS